MRFDLSHVRLSFLREQLLQALDAPVRRPASSCWIELDVLRGTITVRLQPDNRQIAWSVHDTALGDVSWAQITDASFWLDQWLKRYLDASRRRRLQAFHRVLYRDPAIRSALDHAVAKFAASPELPHTALRKAAEAFIHDDIGMVTPLAATWVWQSEGLYDEVRVFCPHFVHWLPSVHRRISCDDRLRGLGDLRAVLRRFGLSAAGWRWLVNHRMPYMWAPTELHRGWELHDWIPIVNAYASVGFECCPDDGFTLVMHDLVVRAGLQEAPVPPWLVAAAWLHYLTLPEDSPSRRWFLGHQFLPVGEWVVAARWTPDANQRRVGWTAFDKAWRAARPMLEEVRRLEVSWTSPVGEIALDGLTAHPITTSEGLVAEAVIMRNCLADWIDESWSGRFIAWSVRDDRDEHVAVFSLRRESREDEWEFDNCMGPSNEFVLDRRVRRLANAVLEAATRSRSSDDGTRV